ncbi:hypothetical protein LEMLEM_LOCUS7794 [Lemmus lemmus]
MGANQSDKVDASLRYYLFQETKEVNLSLGFGFLKRPELFLFTILRGYAAHLFKKDLKYKAISEHQTQCPPLEFSRALTAHAIGNACKAHRHQNSTGDLGRRKQGDLSAFASLDLKIMCSQQGCC